MFCIQKYTVCALSTSLDDGLEPGLKATSVIPPKPVLAISSVPCLSFLLLLSLFPVVRRKEKRRPAHTQPECVRFVYPDNSPTITPCSRRGGYDQVPGSGSGSGLRVSVLYHNGQGTDTAIAWPVARTCFSTVNLFPIWNYSFCFLLNESPQSILGRAHSWLWRLPGLLGKWNCHSPLLGWRVQRDRVLACGGGVER